MRSLPVQDPRFVRGGRGVEDPPVTGLEGPAWWQLVASDEFREQVKKVMVARAFPVRQDASVHLASASKTIAARAADYSTSMYLARVRQDALKARVRDALGAAREVLRSHAAPPAEYPSFLRFVAHGRPKVGMLVCEQEAVDVFSHPRVQRWLGMYWDALPKRAVAQVAEERGGGKGGTAGSAMPAPPLADVTPTHRKGRTARVRFECGAKGGSEADNTDTDTQVVLCLPRTTFARLHIAFHWFLLYTTRSPPPQAEEGTGDPCSPSHRARQRSDSAKQPLHFRSPLSRFTFADGDDGVDPPALGSPWWRQQRPQGAHEAPPPAARTAHRHVRATHSQRRADRHAGRVKTSAAYRAACGQPVAFDFPITQDDQEASAALADRDYEQLGGAQYPKMLPRAAFFDMWYGVVEAWCESHDPGEVSELLRVGFEALRFDPILIGAVPHEYEHIYGAAQKPPSHWPSPHRFYYAPASKPRKDELLAPVSSSAFTPSAASPPPDADVGANEAAPHSPASVPLPDSSPDAEAASTRASPQPWAPFQSPAARPASAPRPVRQEGPCGEGKNVEEFLTKLHRTMDGRYTPTPLLVQCPMGSVMAGVEGFVQPIPSRGKHGAHALSGEALRRVAEHSDERLGAYLDLPGARPFPPPAALRMPPMNGASESSPSRMSPLSESSSPPGELRLAYGHRGTLLGMHRQDEDELLETWSRGAMAKLTNEHTLHSQAMGALERHDQLAAPAENPCQGRKCERPPAQPKHLPKAQPKDRCDLERVVMDRSSEALNTGGTASTTLLEYITNETIDKGTLEAMRQIKGSALDNFNASVMKSRSKAAAWGGEFYAPHHPSPDPNLKRQTGVAVQTPPGDVRVPGSPPLTISRHPRRRAAKAPQPCVPSVPPVEGMSLKKSTPRATRPAQQRAQPPKVNTYLKLFRKGASSHQRRGAPSALAACREKKSTPQHSPPQVAHHHWPGRGHVSSPVAAPSNLLECVSPW
eukprot:TRINITY_DN27351_c0_g1_i1.p1 TRINITY_DN27351_c0_g1~~TRINITY_DN27351_c0_g1_i1.p1  ORF type:complete len:985 (+),score=105.60 TRINITY_DN27351_c0_g1_i1:102-3056(+)